MFCFYAAVTMKNINPHDTSKSWRHFVTESKKVVSFWFDDLLEPAAYFYFWSKRMSHFRPYLMQSSSLRHPPIIQSITTYGGLGWDDPKWQWMKTLAVTFTPTGNLESLGDLLWINNRLRPSAVKRLWSLVGHQLKTHVPELSGVVQRKLFSTSQQWVTNSP